MMGYKYKMSDLNCNYCTKKNKLGCGYSLCPHIMDNLSDLFKDSKFRAAVINAENSRTAHRNTLKYLKKQAAKRGIDLTEYDKDYTDEPPTYNYKPECKGCCYASTGFICHSKNDGSCLMDWIKEKIYAGG